MVERISMISKWLVSGMALSLVSTSAIAAGDSSAKSGGLPQLDISTWPSQLFWLMVTFLIGYVIISRLVTPSISSVLENRSNKISSDIENAKEAQQKAKDVFNAYEASLSDARSQAANAAATAIAEAKADTVSREAAINKKIVASTKKAEAKLAEMKNEALSSLEDLAVETSQQIISQLTPIKATKAVIKKHVKIHAKLQS